MERRQLANLLLRLALGAIFLLSGIGKVFLGYAVPGIDKIITFLPAATSTMVMGILELAIAVLLIIGLLTKITGWAATILLLVIIASGIVLGVFMQAGLFKDVGLLAIAFYLAIVGSRSHSIDTRIPIETKQ